MPRQGAHRAFTLLETLFAVLVITIVAAMAIASYQGYRDRVAMLVDETNQKILAAAVKVAAANSGSVAGSLGELTPADLNRAYALVCEGKRPYTMLAYLGEVAQGLFSGSVAEAESFLPAKYYNNNLKVISCPSDETPPTGFNAAGKPIGGKSYKIHSQARDEPFSWLNDPRNARKVLIQECSEGEDKEFRHKRKGERVLVETSVGGKRGFRKEAVSSGAPGGGAGRGRDEDIDDRDD